MSDFFGEEGPKASCVMTVNDEDVTYLPGLHIATDHELMNDESSEQTALHITEAIEDNMLPHVSPEALISALTEEMSAEELILSL